MFTGFFAAVILPILWGLWGILPYVGEFVTGCERASLILCRHAESFDSWGFFLVPVYLTFIFGTLLAGFRGASKVKKTLHQIDHDSAFGTIGIKSATFAHIVCTTVYFTSLLILFILPGNSSVETQPLTEEMSDFGMALLALFILLWINFFLWIVITITLGFICGNIFKVVAIQNIPTSELNTNLESLPNMLNK